MELTCKSRECFYKSIKTYTSLSDVINDFNKIIECPDCGEEIIVDESSLWLRKKNR
ncbi:hypothetical protein KAU33_15930 [Candidatus Dependentiae bacterium]|nr:hypothetical protein [Candidatus Dependentiae bacterium]